MLRLDYIIQKYGGEQLLAPPAGKLDDVYCRLLGTRRRASFADGPSVVNVVSHYAEGSLMPLLVNKLIFGLVPDKSPFILRPILRMVFGRLTNMLVHPRLKTHADFVSRSHHPRMDNRIDIHADRSSVFQMRRLAGRWTGTHIG